MRTLTHANHETVLKAIGNDDEHVIYLPIQGGDPDFYYQDPLSNAAVDWDVPAPIVPEFVKHGAKTERDAALHWAAAAGSFEKARILLSHGMDGKAPRNSVTTVSALQSILRCTRQKARIARGKRAEAESARVGSRRAKAIYRVAARCRGVPAT